MLFFTLLFCNRYGTVEEMIEWHSFPFRLIKSMRFFFFLMSTLIRRCFKTWRWEENCENQSSTLQFTLSVEMGHQSEGGEVVKVERESHFYTVEAINPEKSRKTSGLRVLKWNLYLDCIQEKKGSTAVHGSRWGRLWYWDEPGSIVSKKIIFPYFEIDGPCCNRIDSYWQRQIFDGSRLTGLSDKSSEIFNNWYIIRCCQGSRFLILDELIRCAHF